MSKIRHDSKKLKGYNYWRQYIVARSIEVDSCWIWQGSLFGGGYGQINYTKSRSWGAHRVSWEAFNEREIGSLQVLHSCDNRACVNPDHLEIGTQSKNIQDMYNKGRGRYPAKKK